MEPAGPDPTPSQPRFARLPPWVVEGLEKDEMALQVGPLAVGALWPVGALA
jgi:hypothetical protein